jgi:hypothetical protein
VIISGYAKNESWKPCQNTKENVGKMSS